jgi:hypothetical protein
MVDGLSLGGGYNSALFIFNLKVDFEKIMKNGL